MPLSGAMRAILSKVTKSNDPSALTKMLDNANEEAAKIEGSK